MSEPDTPQERDDKADALKQEREVKAADLERELKHFRWEVRGYYTLVFIYIFSQIF